MKNKIKVGFLVSYDYSLLKQSLPLVYQYADEIFLAIDKDRKTWKGNAFEIPNLFFEWIKELDIDNKICVYEDCFYQPNFSPMELETRERNLLAKYMGENGWHIQIDTDEYFLNFKQFVDNLKLLKNCPPTIIYAEWIISFKRDETGIYYVHPTELFPIATNSPFYTRAREIFHDALKLKSVAKVLHQSWGRNENELKFKLENWGHANDVDWGTYLNFWRSVNRDNYEEVKNFHPLFPSLWSRLRYVSTHDLNLEAETKEHITALLKYCMNNQ